MAVVPPEERLAIVEEAKKKAVDTILNSAKTIDMLPETVTVEDDMMLEVSGSKKMSVGNLKKDISINSGPNWVDE